MKVVLKSLGWLVGSVPLVIWEKLLFLLTFLCFDVLRVRRNLTIKNIRQAFPTMLETDAVSTGRQSYFNFGMTVIEFLGSRKRFQKMNMTVVNGERLQDALNKGGGAYVLCIHLGNWEFMCSQGAAHFSKVSILAKDIGKGSLAEFVTELRASNGCHVIPRNGTQSATQKIYECLGSNELVGFMVDQSRPGSPRIPLFGKDALTNVGLFQLWMRRPAPIIPVVSYRNGRGSHTMQFLPELDVEQPVGMKFKETVIHNGKKMNAIVEKMIERCPTQYFWMHRRWK